MSESNRRSPLLLPPAAAVNVRRRQLLRVSGGSAALLGTGLLSACGGDDPLGVATGGGGGSLRTSAPLPATTTFTTEGRDILVNGQKFYAKGACYSPVPVGGTYNWVPFGDFFTDPWEVIWQRDLPLMNDIGLNTVRLYSTSPWSNPVDPSTARNVHKKFLDACAAHGVYVWASYPIDKGVFESIQNGNTQLDSTVKQGVELIAEEMGSHPAIIGFTISNELNNATARETPAWWAWQDDLAKRCKNIAPTKLTSVAFVDDSMITPKAAHRYGNGVPNIDVIGINSYRGRVGQGFDILFSSFAQVDKRPLLITEWGCPASTHNPQGQAVELPNNAALQGQYVESHLADLLANRDICSGGYVFEWTDEWWKASTPTVHNASPSSATNAAFPGGYGDEEWFGIHSVAAGDRPIDDPSYNNFSVPDILSPRAAVDVLRKGYQGI